MHLTIEEDDPARADVTELLNTHLDHMRSLSPPESVHALDIEGLKAPVMTFWTARRDGELFGCVALREIDTTHGEIKSMHTKASARGSGVARAMLAHLESEAARRGYSRLSLETGTMDGFLPARSLYARHGYEPCPPFGHYFEDPASVCMTKVL